MQDITQHQVYDSTAALVHSLKRLQLLKREIAMKTLGKYLPEVQTEVSALKVVAGGWEHTDPEMMICLLRAGLMTGEIVYDIGMYEVIDMMNCLAKYD